MDGRIMIQISLLIKKTPYCKSNQCKKGSWWGSSPIPRVQPQGPRKNNINNKTIRKQKKNVSLPFSLSLMFSPLSYVFF
jgi:hypothetical protein